MQLTPKKNIFSGDETLSYGLKGKYITHGYSVIFSPGVKSNHRPHSTLSAKAQIPKFQGQIQGIFTCHSHIPSSEIKELIHQPNFSLSQPVLYLERTTGKKHKKEAQNNIQHKTKT